MRLYNVLKMRACSTVHKLKMCSPYVYIHVVSILYSKQIYKVEIRLDLDHFHANMLSSEIFLLYY